ncbi:hypothetical protein ACFL1H_06350 [Nanoarchaeota archaeon]
MTNYEIFKRYVYENEKHKLTDFWYQSECGEIVGCSLDLSELARKIANQMITTRDKQVFNFYEGDSFNNGSRSQTGIKKSLFPKEPNWTYVEFVERKKLDQDERKDLKEIIRSYLPGEKND